MRALGYIEQNSAFKCNYKFLSFSLIKGKKTLQSELCYSFVTCLFLQKIVIDLIQ